MENNELQHWGIKGQKWGLRRFQNPDGSLTAAGKKRYADDEDDNAPKPKTKEEVLKTGSAKEIMAFKGNITNKEYEDALRRLDYERRLSEFSRAETKTALDKFSNAMAKIDTVRVGAQRAVDAYSLVAKLNNTFNPSFRLPVIDGVNKAFERAEALKKATRLESLEKDVDERGAAAMRGFTDDELRDLNSRTKSKSETFTNKKKYDNTYADEDEETNSGAREAKPGGGSKSKKKESDQTAFDKAKTTVEDSDKNGSNKTSSKKSRTNDYYDADFVDKSANTRKSKSEAKRDPADRLDDLGEKIAERMMNKTISKLSTDKAAQDRLAGAASKLFKTALPIGNDSNKISDSILREIASTGANKARAKQSGLPDGRRSSIKALYKSGKSVADIARQYGMSESAIYKMLEELT